KLPGEDFWITKLRNALELRNNAGLPSEITNCFRLIHGEGDGLPGLVIDYYNGIAIVQAHSMGMHVDRHKRAEALIEVLGQELKSVYYKSQHTLPGRDRENFSDEYLYGM